MSRLGEWEIASSLFETAMALDPFIPPTEINEAKKVAIETLFEQGRTLARDRDIDGAVVKFKNALIIDPSLGIEPDILVRDIANAFQMALQVEPTVESLDAAAQILWENGHELASQGRIVDAIKSFDNSLVLDNSRDINPEQKARELYAADLVMTGEALARDGRIEEALSKFQSAQQQDADIDPDREIRRIQFEETVLGLSAFVAAGDNENAIVQIEKALELMQAGLTDSAQVWNHLCYWGLIYGFAEEVASSACENSVELAPEFAKVYYRDSRGIARALSGDIDGAIDDFSFYVQERELLFGGQRTSWLEQLEAGEDPATIFNDKTIEALKNEPPLNKDELKELELLDSL